MNDNPFASPDDVSHTTQPQSGTGATLIKVLLGLGIIVLLIALLLPFRRNVGEVVGRTRCLTNFRKIAMALHNYEELHGSLPPAYTVDENGRRMHSWRTLILPFLDQRPLHINLEIPWDAPENAPALEASLDVFRCPSSDIPQNHTTYMGLVGADACFRANESRSLSDIKDTSATLMVIEVSPDDAVHWMSPHDTDAQFVLNFGPETELSHAGGTQAAFVDGHVRFLSTNMSGEERRAMSYLSGNRSVSDRTDDTTAQE